MGKVLAVVDRIVIVGALTSEALVNFVWDLKASQINVKLSLIQERFEYVLGHNAKEATKKISSAKDEGAVDHSKQKFRSGCKNFNDQASASKSMDPIPYFKPSMQIWRVLFGEYWARSASHCPAWFIFMTLVEVFGVIERYKNIAKHFLGVPRSSEKCKHTVVIDR